MIVESKSRTEISLQKLAAMTDRVQEAQSAGRSFDKSDTACSYDDDRTLVYRVDQNSKPNVFTLINQSISQSITLTMREEHCFYLYFNKNM